jgi:hypothetical protein
MRAWRPSWVERLRVLIVEAQEKCGAPNNAREIVHQMRFGKIFSKIETDEDIKINLLQNGLNHEVREFLKNGNVGIDPDSEAAPAAVGIDEDQFELWPSPLRDLVANIKRTRVYVPSRGEHVPIMPQEISRAETAEAGEYLKRLASETHREGELLIELSKRKASDWT